MGDTNVTLNGSRIEEVQSFKYLGSVKNAIGGHQRRFRIAYPQYGIFFYSLTTRFGSVVKSLPAQSSEFR